MNKKEEYAKLVKKRKEYKFTEGLINPSQIEEGKYDKEEHLGPWSVWQGNLDAKIILIGQDWGDINYYIENKGYDTDNNPTNRNLVELFKLIGINVGYPSKPNHFAPVFFTNSILGIKKDGGMSGKIKSFWARESTQHFLVPLLKIISPSVIITLGSYAYGEIAYLYGLSATSLKYLVVSNPVKLNDGKTLYAFFHCGGLGIANRNFLLQCKDWQSIVLP